MGVSSVGMGNTNIQQMATQAGVTPDQQQVINQLGQELNALAERLKPLAATTTGTQKTLSPGQQAMQYNLGNGLQLNPTTDQEGMALKKHHKKPDDSGYWEALGYEDDL